MRHYRFTARWAWVVALIVALAASSCAHRRKEPPEPEPTDLEQLQALLKERLLDDSGRLRSRSEAVEELKRLGHELLEDFRKRMETELRLRIERELGPMRALKTESIFLETLGKRGRVLRIPTTIEARPLRLFADPVNTPKTRNILRVDGPAMALYDDLPAAVVPNESEGFRRVYTGDAATAIAAEAELLVALKGGEWVEPGPGGRVANAVAIRGLDLDEGLGRNGNQTYDDTMYVVIEEDGNPPVAYEYRMTTESSSEEAGVGRLDSKQVTYVRGLHRGKDPAFRLKGNMAEGTRQGREGKHKIIGANMHSAYTWRNVNSETPLSPRVSLGCQVVAASKSKFEKSLVELLDEEHINAFPYTIVDDSELSLLDLTLFENNRESVLVRRIPRGDQDAGQAAP